jgi:hypothetical protein
MNYLYIYIADWCNENYVDSNSWGVRFESRPGYGQIRGFSCISSVSPGKYQNSTSIILRFLSFQIIYVQLIALWSPKYSTLYSVDTNNIVE